MKAVVETLELMTWFDLADIVWRLGLILAKLAVLGVAGGVATRIICWLIEAVVWLLERGQR